MLWYNSGMKPTVYIETTIPSYLTAWPSANLIRAAHQQITRDWWAKRDAFDFYASPLVIQECEAGDAIAAAARLAVLLGIPLLEESAAAVKLAKLLIAGVPLPLKATADSLHIAVAAVHGMKYLVTWNCTHIDNATMRPQIDLICRAAGFEPPLICSPEELNHG